MKKLILLFGVAVLCTACPGEITDTYHRGEWWVKNLTDSSISLDGTSVLTGDSVIINLRMAGYYPRELVRFNDGVADYSSKRLYLSDDISSPVKIWDYSEREQAGKQFFNENPWNRYDKLSQNPRLTIWVFTIEQEDLVSE